MNMPWRNLEGPAKLLAICGVVLLVSSGLCGLQWFLTMGGNGGSFDALFVPLGIIELIAVAGSIVVGVVAFFIWATEEVRERSKPGDAPNLGRTSDPQTLFPRENPPDDDEKK